MYAIRSYYASPPTGTPSNGTLGMTKSSASTCSLKRWFSSFNSLILFINPLNLSSSRSTIVITSYSIHYTKLYDLKAGGQVSDNCEINTSSFRFIREIRSGTASPFTVTRTYRIADEHGNIAETDHHILVETDVVLKSAEVELTASSGNWSDTGIWGGSLPTTGDNVTIPAGVTVYVDITTAVCNNITIESGGTLIISA